MVDELAPSGREVPSRGVTSAPSARAIRTRQALYDAATALFMEVGYDETTMADIAERAGTSRRTAFNHFPSKGDITMLWVRQMADRATEVVADSGVHDFLEEIRAYFVLISQDVAAEPDLSRQMMLGWTAAGGPTRYESQLLADITPLLAQGQETGHIDSSVDVHYAARALSDVFQGAVFRWVREPDSVLVSAVDGVVSLVLSAVRPRT